MKYNKHNMNKLLFIILIAVGFLIPLASEAAPFIVSQGGTGATSFTPGLCLKGNGTGPITVGSCGGGGGSDINWTFFNGSGIYVSTTTNQVLIGGSGTTSLAALESKALTVAGGAFYANGSTTLQNFTYRLATGTAATTTNLAITGVTSTLLKTNATGGVIPAVSGTDYQAAGTYVTAISVASANGFAGSSSGGATPALTLSTSITGLLKGNGTAISAASAGTDYEVPLTFGDGLTRTANDIDCDTASGSVFGCLSSADWTTFNNKQPAGTYVTSVGGTGVVSSSGGITPNITVTGGSNGQVLAWLSGAPTWTASTTFATTSNSGGWGFSGQGIQTLNIPVQDGTQDRGLLNKVDWTTFNNKQASGNYITALTGDVTASGPGSAGATLATVNSNVGSFTNANITVNAKGLITAASNGTGGTGNVATSSAETAGQLPYWTSTNGTPATLGSIATTSVTCSGDASCTPFTVIGSSPITITATGGAGGSWATTSEQYFWSQFRDLQVAGSPTYLTPTSTSRGFLVGSGATSTLFNTQIVNGTTTNATTTNLAFTGLTSGGLGVNANGGVYKAATTTYSTGLTYTNGAVTVNTSQNIATLSNLTSNGFVKTSGGTGALSIDTSTYLTGNQTITLSGVVQGSGTTGITTSYTGVDPRGWNVVSGALVPTTTIGFITTASSTAQNLQVVNGTTTNATSTNLSISGTLDIDQMTSALLLTGATGIVAEYAGTSCTNQFVRSLSALGAATCATVANTDLANSSVSYGGVSVSLGGSDATPAFNLADATGLPISTGVSGLGTSVATALGVNVGTAGAFVVNGSALGTPSSGTLTNATGLPIVAGTTGTLTVARGGTGLTTFGGTNHALYTTTADNLASEAAYTYNSSTNILTVDSIQGNASSTIMNLQVVNGTTTNATTTNLTISSLSDGCLNVTSGKVGSTGSACGAAAGSWATSSENYYWSLFRDWSVNAAGNLVPTTTRGILVTASSTIGNGTQAGGLTINGGATTTGSVRIGSGSATILFDGATGSATTTQATTTSLYASSYFRLASESGCATFTSGVLTGSGVACGSGSGGGNSKFATSSDNLFLYPNGGIDIGLGIGTTTPNKLSDLNVASTAPAFILSDTNGATNAKHFGIFFNDGKMYFATTSDAQTATSSAGLQYDPSGSAAFGLGTSTPFYKFSIGAGNGSSSASILVAEHRPATSTTMTVDWTNGNSQNLRIGNAAMTVNFSNQTDGATLKLITCNPTSGTAGTITWGSEIIWAGGTAPSQTTTANKCDVWSFLGTMGTSTLRVFGSVTNNF